MTYDRLIEVAIKSGCKTGEVGMLAMLYHYGGEISSRDLADKVNDSLGKVRLACKKLRDMGLVEFIMEHNGKNYSQLIYRLNIDENGPLKTEGLKEGE